MSSGGCLQSLDWNMKWNGRMENGMERSLYTVTSNLCSCSFQVELATVTIISVWLHETTSAAV